MPSIHSLARALSLAATIVGLWAVPAHAATFTVNRTHDAVDARPGDGVCETAPGNRICTLRAAIQEANARQGADTINLPAGTYTITLLNSLHEDRAVDGDLDITDSLTLVGAGAAKTVITTTRAPIDVGERILHILGPISVDIRGVTIRGASFLFFVDGGAIANIGATLSITQSVVTRGSVENRGGGIFNDRGTVTIKESFITANFAELGGGGGIANSNGTVIVIDSTISNNATDESEAAGVLNVQGTMMIVNSTIADNGAGESFAGGLFNDGGLVIVTNTTFTGNRSGTQDDDTRGGNIVNLNGTITLSNVTITRNGSLGLVFPGGAARGGGLLNLSGRITLHNSLLAHNVAHAGPDCSGVITSLGYNIVGNLSGCTFVRGPSDNVGDPRLGDFEPSATPGRGHVPLLAGSAAIDRGLSPTCGAVDQLNQPRRDGNASGGTQCDRGAVEFQP